MFLLFTTETTMPEISAVYTGLNGIQPAVPGTVMSVYIISVAGSRREYFRSHPLRLIGWNRYMRTHTYDNGGSVVESPAPPTLDLRI